ncbi:MAG: hypothetical protein ABIJ20_02575 [Nanoarchaeota archaeon]|nr:hypothetical protein [Nanoarchaeota archaeon]MBU2406486.1 hypothetical protein [Nanoarchaeota archaeon]
MNKKIIGMIVVLILIVLIIFFVRSKVILIKPRGMITETKPNFVWTGDYDGYNLLVSEEKNFENLIINVKVDERSFVSDELDFGDYYWKIVYNKNNETFETNLVKFTINSFVAFSIGGNFIKNVGNVGSNLMGPTGFVVLEREQEIEIQEGDYRLEQK